MICKYCNTKKTGYLLSQTNTEYIYCESCNEDFSLVHKNMIIDELLEKLVNFLNNSIKRKLKIEIDKENNLISLKINNTIIIEKELKYNFVNADIYHLENVISELVQDNYKFNPLDVDIIVC